MRIIKVILFLLFIQQAYAQNNSLLWEISGNGLKKPSYLYGTFHVRDERVFRFGDSVLAKLALCKAMAGEIVMDSINPMERMKAIMMPMDTTLDMLLTPEEYKIVKVKAQEKLGFLAAAVDRVKPIFTSVMITELKTESDSSEALDLYLQRIAREKQMKVLGIETVEEQLSAIDRISLKEQAEMLVKSMKDEEKYDKILKDMFEIYLTQDLDRMEGILRDSEMPDIMNRSLILERNHTMTGRIEKIIAEQPTFVAIGTAHLVGKEGLIELLRRDGYKVRPVFSTYTGKVPEKTVAANGKPVKASAGFIYTSKDKKYEVAFPVSYQEKEDGKMIVGLDPGSGSLFALTESTNEGQSAESYFDHKIQEFKDAGVTIESVKKSKVNGIPALNAQVKEAGMKMNLQYYYYSKERIIELSVTSNPEKYPQEAAKKFLNSFKKR